MRNNKALIVLLIIGLALGMALILEDEITPMWQSETLSETLQNETRDAEDKARDAGRRPAAVIAFLGISEGMTVIDLIAAGGYYTEVLSLAVGQTGKVYAQNPQRVLEFRDGANNKALSKRLAGNRLSNVIRLDKEMDALGIEPNSIDFAMTALNLHDVYNGFGEDVAIDFAKTIFTLLKPGAGLGVIDHAGAPKQNNTELHRMQYSQATEVLEEAGFNIEATSDLLRNSDDSMDKFVFHPEIRGKTDRFLIRARKPR